MERELRALRDARGEPYRLVPLPWPGAKHGRDGQRLPATYVPISSVINGAVLCRPIATRPMPKAGGGPAPSFPIARSSLIDRLLLIQQYGSLGTCITMVAAGRGTLAPV